MKILLTIILIAASHFNATALVPANPGNAWIGWPFDKTTKPFFGFLQNSAGTTLIQLLTVIAAACFIAALFCLYGKFIPSTWWSYLIVGGVTTSILLFLIHIGPLAIIPILIDIVILYGIYIKHWDKGLLG